MEETNRGGRPTVIAPNDRTELRNEHADFIRRWVARLGVGHNTIRRALQNTKKDPDDSTVTSP